jgi:hypothetical protein
VFRQVEAADLVVLLQVHSAFDLDALASHAQAFLDTRARPTADIASDPGGVSRQTRITGNGHGRRYRQAWAQLLRQSAACRPCR